MLLLALKIFSLPLPTHPSTWTFLQVPDPSRPEVTTFLRPYPLDIPLEPWDPLGVPLDSPLDSQTKPDYQETSWSHRVLPSSPLVLFQSIPNCPLSTSSRGPFYANLILFPHIGLDWIGLTGGYCFFCVCWSINSSTLNLTTFLKFQI